ncbi:hypothetical protein DFH09DRAFT_1291561 [Mycena vulgaris]|nr:hypothetical protein DFH09DRAFT_1291561 [Mycena vulgaris]
MSDSAVIEYRGNCHCGAFEFTFKAPEIKHAVACNCSICFRNDYIWTRTASSAFTVVKGDDDGTLKSYRFGDRAMPHKMRALADVDLESLELRTHDGAAGGAPYEPPAPVATGTVPDGTTDGALWIYPARSTVTFGGLELLAEYAFGIKKTYHGFCKTCGVAMRERFLPGASEPEGSDGLAINFRTINGLDNCVVPIGKGGENCIPITIGLAQRGVGTSNG